MSGHRWRVMQHRASYEAKKGGPGKFRNFIITRAQLPFSPGDFPSNSFGGSGAVTRKRRKVAKNVTVMAIPKIFHPSEIFDRHFREDKESPAIIQVAVFGVSSCQRPASASGDESNSHHRSQQRVPFQRAFVTQRGSEEARTLWSSNDWRLCIMKLNCWKKRNRGFWLPCSRRLFIALWGPVTGNRFSLIPPGGHAIFSITPPRCTLKRRYYSATVSLTPFANFVIITIPPFDSREKHVHFLEKFLWLS